jgi:transposase
MFSYTKAAMERAMKVQEVILRAMAKKITWYQAAEIIGISDRHMRRRRERYEEFGYDGLFDRRRGRPSPKRVPLAQVEQVLGLYRDCYPDLKVRHFHEKLREQHPIELSYSLGEAGVAGSRPGGAGTQARGASQAASTAGAARHVVAHRWHHDQQTSDDKNQTEHVRILSSACFC